MHRKKRNTARLNAVLGQAGLLIISIIAMSFLIGQAMASGVVDTSPKIEGPRVAYNPNAPPTTQSPAAAAPKTSPMTIPPGTSNSYVMNPNIREIIGGVKIDSSSVLGSGYAGKTAVFTDSGTNTVYFSDGATAQLSSKDFTTFNSNVKSVPVGSAREKIPLVGTPVYGMWAHLVTGLEYGILAITLIQLVGRLAGMDDKLVNSLSISAGAGILLGNLAYGAVREGIMGSSGKFLGMSQGVFGWAVGVGVAAAIFIAMYSKEEKKTVTFECLPWEPPIGGAKCDECNKDPSHPCTEYRCRALGQACELVNSGTGKEQCVYKSVNDAKSPIISPWVDALYPTDLKYQPDNSIRPPAIGVKIISGKSSNGCLPAYTPLKFGINTDEPSQCKIDFNVTATFDQMQYYFGESNLYEKNHTQQMKLPAPDAVALGENSPLVKNGGKMTMFVRCMDVNGNFNNDAYAISFCVDSGPDTTPPIIEGFSIPTGSYVLYNSDNTAIEAYVNEPAECKWSTQDKNYDAMENTMQCTTSPIEINANLLYTCKGVLTGIQNRQDNTFYFRCKDNPGKDDKDRNVNLKSIPLVLKGSQPLTISSTGPNETISGSTDYVNVELKVVTTNGAEDGKAVCMFAEAGTNEYVNMFETGEVVHTQTLSLTAGNYDFAFKCIDAGGNIAEANTDFTVKTDKSAPQVTRVYRKGDALAVVTDEDAQCVYSLTTCNYQFEQGLEFVNSPVDVKDVHYAEWKDNSVYYIKCKDMYGNEPDPAKCNIIASSSKINSEI